MFEVRADLKSIHHHLGLMFDYFYVESARSEQNASVFDDIAKGAYYVLEHASWVDRHEGEIVCHKIRSKVVAWLTMRNFMRAKGAALNREAILNMKKETLAIIEEA